MLDSRIMSGEPHEKLHERELLTEEQLNLPLPGFIERPKTGLSIPRADRVFTNRNLRLAQIDWVGFDMDYTIAIYRQKAMDELSVLLSAERLVRKGYPSVLNELDFDTGFPMRGLLVDKKLGNILKLDRHKVVTKGYHGQQELQSKEINELYGQNKLSTSDPRYHWIDTLFALCEVTSYAALVNALEKKGEPFDPERLFADVRQAIDQAHADGAVYEAVTSRIKHYIDKDPLLSDCLHKLRSSGKRLFLLTNSPYHYTNDVMTYLLGDESDHYPDWKSYFDVVVCAAKKPLFFREGTPLLQREGTETHEAKLPLERGQVYEGGSLKTLEAALNIQGERVLYIGDHIYGDILRSKKDASWKTAFIVQELDRETNALEKTARLRERRRQLAEARPLFEDELRYYNARFKELNRGEPEADQALSLTRAKTHIDRLRQELTALEVEHQELNQEIDAAFHPYWGSLLKEMSGKSLFGQQVDTYADIYMRRVSSLGYYSPTQLFRSPHDLMPHEF